MLPQRRQEFSSPRDALGQKRTLVQVQSMSALPPKADIRRLFDHLHKVPTTEVDTMGGTLR
jgi:hypothetical protein